MISAKTRILGVTGWPVEHSKSPALQNAALRHANLDFVYLAFPIAPEDFEVAVKGLAAAGVVGLNCTIPHKHAALAICSEVTDIARKVGAVNTLHFRPEGIFGTNTDVEGYVKALQNEGRFSFVGKNVVQLGAGGAGRGMAFGALEAGAKGLALVNRSFEKAQRLVEDLRAFYPSAKIDAFSPELHSEQIFNALGSADLVSNATSLGLAEGDPFPCHVREINPQALVFDAAYTRERSTAWLRAAAAAGLRTLDGLSMLVRQGTASFRIWTGQEPDLDAMFDALSI